MLKSSKHAAAIMCFLKLQNEEYYVTAHAPRLQLLMEQRQRLAI